MAKFSTFPGVLGGKQRIDDKLLGAIKLRYLNLDIFRSKFGVGVRGRVIDSKGNGIEASIVVKGRNFTVWAF